MAEPPAKRSALRRWWMPLLVVVAAACAYATDLHTRILASERLWWYVTIAAGVFMVLGSLAQFILPFAHLFDKRPKPPHDS